MTGIAFVGTGFVADYYMTTLANHPALRLLGVYDADAHAQKRFADFYRVPAYPSLLAVLDDPKVAIVVNLTTPESHFEISRQALNVGKHVYSEKPLAMDFDEAETLVRLARSTGLTIASAPANALSPTANAVRAAIAAGEIGAPRLVYAEMEDGPVFRGNWRSWRSVSGAPWPGQHEFEIGCTLEHAGYALSWLVSLMGPATAVTAFSTLAFQQKGQKPGSVLGPDFSVGVLTFGNGVVARLTSGLSAPKDRSLTIMGEDGAITVADLWDHTSQVRIERAGDDRSFGEKLAGRIEARLGRTLVNKPRPGKALKLPAMEKVKLPAYPSRIDFCGGIAAQAEAIAQGKAPFFSGDVALHITEIALALSNAGSEPQPYKPRSTFTLPTG